VSEAEEIWTNNYFNYFTEAEEHFQKARGTGLFLLSPLDWALIEGWKNSGVPLEAVLRGIDAAFEKWRSRKSKVRMINSIAYCTQEVLGAAQAMAGAAPRTSRPAAAAPFEIGDLQAFLSAAAGALRKLGQQEFDEISVTLTRIETEAGSRYEDLEELERLLTALEEKMLAVVRSRQTEDELLAARRELDLQLRPYRGRMTADQLAMIERQYLDRRLFESAGLPRLSLFYLR